jgi:hypothetical protein
MRGFGWIGALIGLILVIGAGVIGYNLGLGANIAASGATVVQPMYGWGFGFGFFPFFGFIFFFLILLLIFGAFRRAAWGGHHGYGWRGRGYGDIEELHRQLHEESTKKTDG